VSYRVVAEFGPPGIVAHGVALKPGKPLCLAVIARESRRPVPVAVLPGFPTSAVFTFHEFVAPVLRELAGRPTDPTEVVTAVLPQRLNSERGRTEYVLVGLVPGQPPTAFPMGKGSGSVTAFGRADGFLTIPRQREYLEAGERVEVRLLGGGRPADLVVIGSHCLGLDYLLGQLRERGFSAKVLAVGSTAGLEAARRGECDVAGVHLLDEASDEYNRPFLTPGLELIPGYGRLQGVVFRRGDDRFEGDWPADPTCVLANRNRGSGTRILIDRLLNGAKPPGYLSEARSHAAVVAAVAQGRADWGVAIEPAAREYGLGFRPLREERFDFVVPAARLDRPAVRAFREVLAAEETKAALRAMGFSA
jgi:putative molybdopterin biosynthesis protein